MSSNPTISIDRSHIRTNTPSSRTHSRTHSRAHSRATSLSSLPPPSPTPSMSTFPTVTSASSSIRQSLDHSSSRRSISSSSLINPTTASTTTVSSSQPPSPNPARAAYQTHRSNRSALRQFYGLKKGDSGAGEAAGGGGQGPGVGVEVPEIDREGFNSEAYVEELCKTADLAGLLRVENELVNDIRGLDGERKALVYDNYSKLIVATDTIKKMRSNMEPLTPTTSTLEPAIAHIAQLATSLAQSIHNHQNTSSAAAASAPSGPGTVSSSTTTYTSNTDATTDPSMTPTINHIPPTPTTPTPTSHNIIFSTSPDSLRRKQETVRWALSAPDRIHVMLKNGQQEKAREEWDTVVGMLDKWKGVKGVEELRKRGEEALKGG